MSEYSKLARQYRERADRLEHMFEHVGPLPQVDLDECDGSPVGGADTHNVFIRDTIKALRDAAQALDDLAYTLDYVDADARTAFADLWAHDPAKASDAEDGWMDAQVYADDARDLY